MTVAIIQMNTVTTTRTTRTITSGTNPKTARGGITSRSGIEKIWNFNARGPKSKGSIGAGVTNIVRIGTTIGTAIGIETETTAD